MSGIQLEGYAPLALRTSLQTAADAYMHAATFAAASADATPTANCPRLRPQLAALGGLDLGGVVWYRSRAQGVLHALRVESAEAAGLVAPRDPPRWLVETELFCHRCVEGGLSGLLARVHRPLRKPEWRRERRVLCASSPRVELYPNFLSPSECDHLLRLGLFHAAVGGHGMTGGPATAGGGVATGGAPAAGGGGATGGGACGGGATDAEAALERHVGASWSLPLPEDAVSMGLEERCAVVTGVPRHELEPPLTLTFSAEVGKEGGGGHEGGAKEAAAVCSKPAPALGGHPLSAPPLAVLPAPPALSPAFPPFIQSAFPTKTDWERERAEWERLQGGGAVSIDPASSAATGATTSSTPADAFQGDDHPTSARPIAHRTPSLRLEASAARGGGGATTSRCATVIIFLHDVPTAYGGYTCFPAANQPPGSPLQAAARTALRSGACCLERLAASPPTAEADAEADAEAEAGAGAEAEAGTGVEMARQAREALLWAADAEDVGLHVQPRRGSACVYWTLDSDGVDPASWCGTAPVVYGGGGRWAIFKSKELPAAYRSTCPPVLPPELSPPTRDGVVLLS